MQIIENATVTAVKNEDMEPGTCWVLPADILPDSDLNVNDWFFRMFDVSLEETGYDPDLTLSDVEIHFSEHGGVPVPKKGYASKYPIYTTVLLMTVLLMRKQTTLYQWYTFCFSTDTMIEDLNPQISVTGLLKTLRDGEDVYKYIGAIDSVIRCRLFCAASAMTGYGYDELYRLWLQGIEKRSAI